MSAERDAQIDFAYRYLRAMDEAFLGESDLTREDAERLLVKAEQEDQEDRDGR